MKLIIKQNKNKEYERVTVECRVKNKKSVLNLQKKIKQALPQINLQNDTDLHATIYHFGKPQDLYIEVMCSGSEIDFTQFMEHFYSLITDCQKLCNKLQKTNYKIITNELVLLGSKRNKVIAIEIGKPARLTKLKEDINNRLKLFLLKCEVNNILNFIRNSTNLRYAPYKDKFHLTLGRIKNQKVKKFKPGNITITLLPPHLRNIEYKR